VYDLHPLLFEPIYKQKIWGGDAFRQILGRTPPTSLGTRLGESWELADLEESDPEGGGGEAERSLVARALLKGRSLRELLLDNPKEIMGPVSLSPDGGFPLLIKYLDATQDLSIQVHPKAAYVAQREGLSLKSEAWSVLRAEPGAVIYLGFKKQESPESVRQALQEGRLQELLHRQPAKSGDLFYLPAGTCHALGAGCLVAEVQTSSDTTFRLHDWDRKPARSLHIEEALECMDFGPLSLEAHRWDFQEKEGGLERQGQIQCEHFRIAELSGEGLSREGRPRIWMLRKKMKLEWGCHILSCQAYDTILLPANLNVRATESEGSWLEIQL